MASVLPPLTEAQFQRQVIDLAKRCGWMVFHPTTSTRNGAWATFQAGHRGFPDLVLAHRTKGVVFAELKTDRGRPSPEQTEWSQTLTAGGAEWHLWRPRDWDAIRQRLT